MFEQSILFDHAAGKRTGALALSVTVQTLAVGALLLIPLLFSDRLPTLKPWIPLSAPLSQPPPRPRQIESSATVTRGTLSMPRVFVLPSRVPTRAIPDVPLIPLDGIAPQLDGFGQMGVPFAPPGLDRVISVAVPRALPETPTQPPPKPITVSSGVQTAKLINRVIPAYPPIAKAARVSGTVRLMGVIAKDGTIQQLHLMSGPALLVGAAIDAVRQWRYRPTLLNGEAVEVIAPIDVVFTLSQ